MGILLEQGAPHVTPTTDHDDHSSTEYDTGNNGDTHHSDTSSVFLKDADTSLSDARGASNRHNPSSIEGTNDLKAAFFDVDGTLTSFVTHEVPQSTIDALHELQQRDVKVIICSGRAPSNLNVVTDTIPIRFDGVIALNGQYCYDPEGFVSSRALELQDVQTITTWLDEHPQAVANYCEEDYAYINRLTEEVRAAGRKLGRTTPPIHVDDPHLRILDHPTYQISTFVDDATERDIVAQCHNVKGERWHPDFVDLMPADGGKAAGMRRFLEHCGWRREQTVAFGDGGNDVSMLRFAGLGVAMGKAAEQAKQAADYVTLDVDDDGIAHALKHFSII